MKRQITLLCPTGAIFLTFSVLCIASEPPSWLQAQREVVAVLREGKTDLAGLVKQVNASPPATCREALFKLNVLLRAGVDRAAVGAVDDLKKCCQGLGDYEIRAIYYEACDHFEAWEVARRLVEVFADEVSDIEIENRLLKHFEEVGWSVEAIDRWLADRPPGREGFWIVQRVRFNNVHGRAEALIRDLQNQIKRRPQDIDAAMVFLTALAHARHADRDRWDLSWMAQTVRPSRATQAERLGAKLRELQAWPTAVTFYRLAFDIPLTEEEVTEIGRRRQVRISPEVLRAHFTIQIRESMAECLLALGRNEEAQQWMVEAADLRARHGLGLNPILAGVVQGASGQRVIEGRIKEEQATREDDPEYWRQRAGYYRGRNEPGLEEEAWHKGLALTPPPIRERPSKGYVDQRRRMLSDYARFLQRRNREAEAVMLLQRELEQAPANAASAEGAAHLLAFEFPKHLDPKDEVLWTWLAGRPKWEYTEERFLWRMLENAPRNVLDVCLTRAERLTPGQDPSRAKTLGWIMNRMGLAKRSIPLLEYAAQHAPDTEFGERAIFTLFESCLDSGDWKRAEELLPQATGRMTPTEAPEWCSRLAFVAAQGRAKADAMRLWRMAASTDVAELAYLSRMSKAGLHEELTAFYSEMAQKIPSSEIPGRALQMLQSAGHESIPVDVPPPPPIEP
jgi:tetratricopeptide (TPR) repeat protein